MYGRLGVQPGLPEFRKFPDFRKLDPSETCIFLQNHAFFLQKWHISGNFRIFPEIRPQGAGSPGCSPQPLVKGPFFVKKSQIAPHQNPSAGFITAYISKPSETIWIGHAAKRRQCATLSSVSDELKFIR